MIKKLHVDRSGFCAASERAEAVAVTCSGSDPAGPAEVHPHLSMSIRARLASFIDRMMED